MLDPVSAHSPPSESNANFQCATKNQFAREAMCQFLKFKVKIRILEEFKLFGRYPSHNLRTVRMNRSNEPLSKPSPDQAKLLVCNIIFNGNNLDTTR